MICACGAKNPYFKYYFEFLSKVLKHNKYVNVFNYEYLIKLNISIFSYFERYDKDNDCFVINLVLENFLHNSIFHFKLLGLDKTDEKLFKKFVELKETFLVVLRSIKFFLD